MKGPATSQDEGKGPFTSRTRPRLIGDPLRTLIAERMDGPFDFEVIAVPCVIADIDTGLIGDRVLRHFTTTYDLAGSRMIFALPPA